MEYRRPKAGDRQHVHLSLDLTTTSVSGPVHDFSLLTTCRHLHSVGCNFLDVPCFSFFFIPSSFHFKEIVVVQNGLWLFLLGIWEFALPSCGESWHFFSGLGSGLLSLASHCISFQIMFMNDIGFPFFFRDGNEGVK